MNLNYHKMKFLRLAFYVLIAQLVLSGCAGEGVEETSSSSASEINFDAYVGRNASTRSSVTDIKFLQGSVWNAGFGVFARYGNTHLMDTEHVTWREGHWGYDHIRFWPSSGTVDFYAFAPYSPQVRMDKLRDDLADKLVDKTHSKDETYIDFPSNMSPVDLIWANQPNQTAPTSPKSKVKFQFQHALVRLGFDITANQKLEEKGAVITVDKVILYGANETSGIFLMAGYLNLKTGDWVPYNNNFSWFYTWTPTGKVDGKNDEQLKIDGPIYKLSAPQLDNNTPSIANEKDSYIFIIPQDPPANFNLKITYKVKQGNFVEDVTVYKDLLKVLPKDPFGVKGKAYTFHFKLSLDPVKFDVTTTVGNWIGNVVEDEITI